MSIERKNTESGAEDERTNQEALKDGLTDRIKNGLDIPSDYLSLASEETIQELKQNQEAIKDGLTYRIKNGRGISGYLPLASEETLSIFENETELRTMTEGAVRSFFNNTEELEQEIIETTAGRSKKELEKILFDKTLLPVGIKIHTKENPIIGLFMEKTGGFVAHKSETCFVANPVANTSILELCLEALDKKMKLENLAFDKDTYFQTCVPERLNNEMCGIATIAFLLARKKTLQYTKELITHNQDTIGVTIYDAGKVVIGEHFVPTKDDHKENPQFNGRTDMLLCGNLEDIKIVQLLLSLLVHANYQEQELKHRELGQNFINEFKAVLAKHNNADWLNNQFVDLKTQDVDGLSVILLAITNHRNETNEYVKNYNQGVQYLETEKDSIDDVYRDLKEIKKNIDNNLSFEIKALIEKYRQLVYPDGKYIDEREYAPGLRK